MFSLSSPNLWFRPVAPNLGVGTRTTGREMNQVGRKMIDQVGNKKKTHSDTMFIFLTLIFLSCETVVLLS